MRSCAGLVFTFLAFASAQTPKSVLDGRFWRSASSDMRLGYIAGYWDGLGAGLAALSTDTKENEKQFREAWPDLKSSEIEESMTRFYEAPENRPFDVAVAFRAVVMKSKGAPQEQIDSFLNIMRHQRTKGAQ